MSSLAPKTSSRLSRIERLGSDNVFALQNAIHLDGRVGSYPLSARGYTCTNCYLLRESSAALLLDTGFASQEDAVVGQLEALLGGAKLSVFPLRINEFMSVGNALAIARRVGVEFCYSIVPDAAYFMDVESISADDIAAANQLMPTRMVPSSRFAEIGDGTGRMIEFVRAPLQLIPTRWMYDEASKTLFTSDLFSHVWRGDLEQGFVVDETNDRTTKRDIRSYMLNTRYWWLEGAATTPLRESLAEVFTNRNVETIAPGYGCILKGAKTAMRHYEMLDQVLAELDESCSTSSYVHHMQER